MPRSPRPRSRSPHSHHPDRQRNRRRTSRSRSPHRRRRDSRDGDRNREDRDSGRDRRRNRSRSRERRPSPSFRDRDREPRRNPSPGASTAPLRARSDRDRPDRSDAPRNRPNPRSRRDDYSSSNNSGGPRPPLTGANADTPDAPVVEKQKPTLSTTGLLAAASNTVNSTVLKYSEPADSRKPPPHPAWKLFVFKDAKVVETIDLNERSCWLVGRDRAVADLVVEHPSCSKQHAVLQWRWRPGKGGAGGPGGPGGKVKLYLMDLESANGTLLGGERVEGARFVEIREGDLVKFGTSTREYVVVVEKD